MSPREILAKADDHRRYERSAETAMRLIRLDESPRVRKRERRRFFVGTSERTHVFDAFETRVIYEALDLVREHHRTEAEAWEAKVQPVDATRNTDGHAPLSEAKGVDGDE